MSNNLIPLDIPLESVIDAPIFPKRYFCDSDGNVFSNAKSSTKMAKLTQTSVKSCRTYRVKIIDLHNTWINVRLDDILKGLAYRAELMKGLSELKPTFTLGDSPIDEFLDGGNDAIPDPPASEKCDWIIDVFYDGENDDNHDLSNLTFTEVQAHVQKLRATYDTFDESLQFKIYKHCANIDYTVEKTVTQKLTKI
jgi:hypothetical protein